MVHLGVLELKDTLWKTELGTMIFVGRFLDNIREFGEGKIHALIIPELSTFLLKGF